MRHPLKIIFILLLALTFAFAVTACSVSVGSSKISKGDIAKLNAANTALQKKALALGTILQKGKTKCAMRETLYEQCMAPFVASFAAKAQAAAEAKAKIYDQVAKQASGSCQTALHAVAKDERASAAALLGGGGPSQAVMTKHANQVASTCGLDKG